MLKDYKTAVVAGLLSSGLFLLFLLSGMALFLFVPALPILSLGLSRHPRIALQSVGVAMLMILILSNTGVAFLFLLLIGSPSLYIGLKSLRWRPGPQGEREWLPIGIIFVNLTLYACLAVALAVFYYADEPGGIAQVLSHNIHEMLPDLEAEYGDFINVLFNQWLFLIFPFTIWPWGLALYGHAWIANRMLLRKKTQLRPDFAIHTFTMPLSMLYLLAVSALASMIGSDSMQFLGKATLITLLLPYFFLGAGVLYDRTATWSNRGFLISFLYFMALTQFWPGLLIATYGLWYQLTHLNKHLSGSGTSSNN